MVAFDFRVWRWGKSTQEEYAAVSLGFRVWATVPSAGGTKKLPDQQHKKAEGLRRMWGTAAITTGTT